MITNAIIGAGELGSRHLQGLIRYDELQTIYVVDPSEDSLKKSKERALEIEHGHDIIFVNELQSLPLKLDMVIVATQANIREGIINNLLDKHEVRFLILEKVLFQEIDSFERVSKLLKQKNVKTWVNHPRRIYPLYQQIKSSLTYNTSLVFSLTGNNWFIGCNGLHFIDLFAYLSDSSVAQIDFEWLDEEVITSKRKGYIDFTGTVKGKFKNGNVFSISSFKGNTVPVLLNITGAHTKLLVLEGDTAKLIDLGQKGGLLDNGLEFKTQYQSSLTPQLAKLLFETGSCGLPTYEEASASHVPFITELLKKYQQLTGNITTQCPIT
jgi:hypothetical protein